MNNDKSDKTEKPTPRRIREARKEGQVAKSQDLGAAAVLLGLAGFFIPAWQFVIQNYLPYMVASLQNLTIYQAQMNDLPKLALQAIWLIILGSLPFMGISLGIGLFINLVQTRLNFSVKALKPDFKKLNPVTGIKNMFSMQAFMNLAKTIAKLAVIVYLCVKKYQAAISTIAQLSQMEMGQILYFVLHFAQELMLQIALVFLVLGGLDYIYQRHSLMKQLKMSKQEIKEEVKQNEGDANIKAQRKAKYQQMLQNAIANVKDATVVITNPTHFAVAIQYEKDGLGIPQVIAKGADEIAQRMKAEAKKLEVPMVENVPLARGLYAKVKVGDVIPDEFFGPVAEVLALVYQLEEEAKHKI
ncbi:MAG: EscU/YscU/HrcU family type III secretion system export apparatus switch protein [Ligilactobacillus agilis]|uniref:EscU/YscU/HrcU family type III secretion system export apparatus switch protein n=1 Tax=Ligilactobacillus agilis TaxID=1601 RepID=UPI00242A6D2B|nr:EscU/YscU/HrcU family type III secretion system export apparatus switch protein [Ligilactobacillus agilis]MCI5760918.1 EscU/YscU/HrcU family type III secretion system export apparatus switch protein [Ligilactobacillus agilis]MCL8205578.1 EscU/YscU/HrcU family type III secretion system export apparatus switch protein [Ligilactobacillus agilis]MDY4066022.1 EscU/YscU/HrcU family type III secretion system export apparatus switch protein [Ligilactobacillus agilis]